MKSVFGGTTLNLGGENDVHVITKTDDVTSNDTDNVPRQGLILKSLDDLTVDTIFAFTESFISLDISKTSTGWVRYKNGKHEYGHFTITADSNDLTAQRREFRNFIIDLFQNQEYEFVFIEDTIGSVNHKTARILNQLNAIPDDLMDMGLIPKSPIIREDNKVWKSNLRFIANYKPLIKGEDDKTMIRNALKKLGFGDGTESFVVEDIYDAHGLAVGGITRLKLKSEPVKKQKLRTDISKVYKIEQFADEYEALDRANELNRHIENIDFSNISRDLKFHFKKYVTELGDDTRVFVIAVPTSKIGSLLISKNLSLDYEVSYLVVYRKLK